MHGGVLEHRNCALLSEADVYLDTLIYGQILGEIFIIAIIGLFCFALVLFIFLPPPLFFKNCLFKREKGEREVGEGVVSRLCAEHGAQCRA